MVGKKKPTELGSFGLNHHGEGDATPKYLKAFAMGKVLENIDANTPFIGLFGHVEAIEKTADNTIRMMLRIKLYVEDPETFPELFEIFQSRNRDFVGLVVS